ncbi:MAG: polysaccharide biosynthesis/export family protein [Terracidiphilus sp.]|nr:polysaccharide biosynthesis/export family protein [Terracidiphilus sp.]
MAKRNAIRATVCALLLILSAGIEAQQTAFKAPTVRISAGDLLELIMYDNADLSGRLRVDDKGDVRVPLLGAVHVAGDTAEEAAMLIQKRYVDEQILTPATSYASVSIAETTTQNIVVTGDVRSPGTYPATGVKMLNDVMTSAGGLLQTASTEIYITHRDDPEHPVTVVYDPFELKPVVPQIQILPGDTITVPKAGVVYALGSLQRAGAFVMEPRNPLTMYKLMALAGPDRHGSKLNKVQLVREAAQGSKEIVTLNVAKILKGEAADVVLKDGDIVYVQNSAMASISPQLLATALGMGSSVLLYRLVYH